MGEGPIMRIVPAALLCGVLGALYTNQIGIALFTGKK